MIPNDLHYTEDHEWVRTTDSGVVRVGITDYAQNSLGDIVYVQLPELGATCAPGDAVGEVESTKSVSDIMAPLAGTITARNDALEDTPEVINTDPYGDGWLFEIEPDDAGAAESLLDADGYADVIGEG